MNVKVLYKYINIIKIKRFMDNEAAWSENQKTEDYIYEHLSKPIYFKAKCVLCCI